MRRIPRIWLANLVLASCLPAHMFVLENNPEVVAMPINRLLNGLPIYLALLVVGLVLAKESITFRMFFTEPAYTLRRLRGKFRRQYWEALDDWQHDLLLAHLQYQLRTKSRVEVFGGDGMFELYDISIQSRPNLLRGVRGLLLRVAVQARTAFRYFDRITHRADEGRTC